MKPAPAFRAPSAVPGFALLLLLVLLSWLIGGCAATAPPDDYLGVPDTIPYAEVDRRQFEVVGQPVLTRDEAVLTVEAARQDTLMWFEAARNGRFQNAFLRRGNTVYTLGPEGDYMRASTTQSAIYSIFLEQWRTAQGIYAAARAPRP